VAYICLCTSHGSVKEQTNRPGTQLKEGTRYIASHDQRLYIPTVPALVPY
jgi:hypothetical protein